ncbi:hypothetical protein LVJ94_40920 [Pendulispora rubella]|uniref:Lipoprotein n=1 Tax=Pendulispora rubella TaxID=2741070 RepID=A0ABZ2L1Z4_9BACT
MHQSNKFAISIVFCVASAACGSSPTPAPVSVASTSAPSVEPQGVAPSAESAPAESSTATITQAEVAATAAAPLPTTCTVQGTRKACVPDADYAKKLCSTAYPDVALSLFSQGTPFTRAYMTRDVDGWNAGGGRTSRSKLLFDEEVLVVAHRKANANGIVLVAANGDTGSYDVLRWDGSCVSVMAEEITMNKAPKPKRAAIPWRRLEEPTKSALLAAPKVKASLEARDKACGGDDEGKCTKAEVAFTGAIADFVRTSKSLPEPTRRP